jgi:hypothetical protein
MTTTFNAIDELRRHGLAGDSIPPATGQILSALTKPEVEFLVQAKQHIATSTPDGPSLTQAMVPAFSWDRPNATPVDAEVEGMSEGSCLCACTGGGGGGGAG